MGYIRNLPRDVVYTSEDLCGLGVYHPWHNQHLSQMQILLQETALPTIMGDLIRALLEQLRLEVGLPGCWTMTSVVVARNYCALDSRA
jgi:hypothetical protein